MAFTIGMRDAQRSFPWLADGLLPSFPYPHIVPDCVSSSFREHSQQALAPKAVSEGSSFCTCALRKRSRPTNTDRPTFWRTTGAALFSYS